MRCLVLGGNGFIGSHLVDLLVSEDHEVRILDHSKNPLWDPPAGVQQIRGEWRDQKLVQSALDGVDVVVHLISTMVPDAYDLNSSGEVWFNTAFTLQILGECVEEGIRRFVFASSGGTIYGVPQETPIPESHPLKPICSYGMSKLIIEKYLEMFRHLYGLEYVILRPANAYGIRQNLSGRQGAVGIFLGNIMRGEQINLWGDGSVVRDFVYVGDLAVAFYRAMIYSNLENRVFNIGSGNGVSINQVLETLSVITGRDPDIHNKPARKFDVPINILDVSLARDHLMWTPTVDLVDGLRSTWMEIQRGSK